MLPHFLLKGLDPFDSMERGTIAWSDRIQLLGIFQENFLAQALYFIENMESLLEKYSFGGKRFVVIILVGFPN